jgi:LCP family protein required for cell wall assembly
MTVTRPRSPLAAATLSLFLPGLGEWLVGARRRALLVATPAIVLAAITIGAAASALAGGGLDGLLDLVLRPELLVAVIVLDLAALAYHDLAILDAWLVARRTQPTVGRHARAVALVGVAVVLVLSTSLHGAIAAVGLDAQDTLNAVFPEQQGDEWVIPEPSFEPEDTPSPSVAPTASPTGSPTHSPATATASPTASPSPSPTSTPKPVPAWAKDGRLNLLIVGSDAGPDRWLLRTDTMVVLSVDVKTGWAALFGIPRNVTGVPLPPESAGAFANGRFPGMLNALYVYAWGHPNKFPGGDARGFRAVTGAVQELIGVRLDGFVAVDLLGFVKLVDALGGLWIRVPERLVDNNYPKIDGSGTVRIVIQPGCQKLDGTMALAYARSRHQDSDYGRMRRQQIVLLWLRRELDPVALVPKAPALLKLVRDHLWTTIKRSDLASLAKLAGRVDARDTVTVRFTPPDYPEHLTTAAIGNIQSVVRHVFDHAPAKSAGINLGKACP